METNDRPRFRWESEIVHGRAIWRVKYFEDDETPVEGEEKMEDAVEESMRDPRTEEQMAAHEAIKKCMSNLQNSALEKLEQVIEKKGGKLLLCDDPELSDLKHLIKFITSSFANEGSSRMKVAKNRSIPVLRLCKTDFDSRGDIEFSSPNGKLQSRGGMPYHQPDKTWIRVGLKCRGMYDYGNDDWLAMNGNPNEWAVGFHGSSVEGNVGIAESRKFHTKTLGLNLHKDDLDVNPRSRRKGRPCGKGAYFASKIDVPANKYAREVEGEKCVFQVRLKPSEVRIPEGNLDYMIVSKEQYARPYAICLKDTAPKDTVPEDTVPKGIVPKDNQWSCTIS